MRAPVLPRMRGGVRKGIPEHHIVGASFAREHGIMTAAQAAGAGDTVGLECWQCGSERFDSRDVGAVGAGATDHLGAAFEQERDIAALHGGCDRLGAFGQAAFIGVGLIIAFNFTAVMAARRNYSLKNLVAFTRQAREAAFFWCVIFAMLPLAGFVMKISSEF